MKLSCNGLFATSIYIRQFTANCRLLQQTNTFISTSTPSWLFFIWHSIQFPLRLSPIYTSTNVEATGNDVKATFDFEATIDFVAKNGNNVERVYRQISSFQQISNDASTLLPFLETMLPFLAIL